MTEDEKEYIVRALREVEKSDEDVVWAAENLHDLSEADTRAILAKLNGDDVSPEPLSEPEPVPDPEQTTSETSPSQSQPEPAAPAAPSTERKVNRNGALVLGISAAVIVLLAGLMAFARYQKQKAEEQAYFTEMMYRASQQQQQAPPSEEIPYQRIDREVAATNRQLPSESEQGITVEKMAREGKRIVIYSTFNDFSSDDIDADTVRDDMTAEMQQAVCQQKASTGADWFYRPDFTFEYAYAGNDGQHIVSAVVSPADCQK